MKSIFVNKLRNLEFSVIYVSDLKKKLSIHKSEIIIHNNNKKLFHTYGLK